MATTFKVNYNLTNCELVSEYTDLTYTNDGSMWKFVVKSVEGTKFTAKDGEHNYVTRTKSGTEQTEQIKLSYSTSSSNDSKVMTGQINGISSDGRYMSFRYWWGDTNTSPLNVYLNATTGTPTVKTLTINNEVANTSATYSKDDTNFIVKIGGDENGMFNTAPIITFRNKYNEIQQESMSLSDSHNATYTIPQSTNENVTITGTYETIIPSIEITNNVANTTASYVIKDNVFVITLNATTDGTFTTPPVCIYGSNSVTMNVNGKTATCEIPTTQTECTINGTFTPLSDKIVVTNILTNCIITPTYESVSAGDTIECIITPNDKYELKKAFLIWSDGINDTTQAIDLNTGAFTFVVPQNCKSIKITGYAELITPVGYNYGCINVYKVTMDALDSFSKKRFFEESSTSASGIEFIDLGKYVNRLKRVFLDVPVSTTGVINCGNYSTGVSCEIPETDNVVLDFGYLTITGMNGNTHDYDSTLQVFLPFVGFVSLDKSFVDKTINLTYKVNIITGNGVAIISYMGTPVMIHDVSVCRNILYKTNDYTNNTYGSDSFDENSMYGFEPYVLMNYTISQALTQHTANTDVIVGDIKGLAKFENVNVNVNCLADEQSEIQALLGTGVIL